MKSDNCELCSHAGGEVVWQGDKWRVVLANEAAYPGFCRVIWNEHVKEMTDLAPEDRSELMRTVCRVESIVREVMQPDKINLASLGNMVPHLHWHVIPRFADDAQFPASVWSEPRRETAPASIAARAEMLPALRAALIQTLSQP